METDDTKDKDPKDETSLHLLLSPLSSSLLFPFSPLRPPEFPLFFLLSCTVKGLCVDLSVIRGITVPFF